ncbi:hypothetical protein F4806DRAFT_459155 [Annulohypoxylon nitens]|nr:hypothetical protein F4806DRAFT_459155 [Annulohypoxylon nitens]
MPSQRIDNHSSGHEETTGLSESQEQETLQNINPIEQSHVGCELSQSAMYGLPLQKKRIVQDHNNLLFHLTSKESSVRMSRLMVNTTRLIFCLVLLLNGYFNFIPILIADVIAVRKEFPLFQLADILVDERYATVYVSFVAIETTMSLGVLVVISLELVNTVDANSFGVNTFRYSDPIQTGTLLTWFPVL